MTILHNGTRYYAHRTYSDEFMQTQRLEWMRMNTRRILSNEIIQLSITGTTTITESN